MVAVVASCVFRLGMVICVLLFCCVMLGWWQPGMRLCEKRAEKARMERSKQTIKDEKNRVRLNNIPRLPV